jgi:hypothetical protein
MNLMGWLGQASARVSLAAAKRRGRARTARRLLLMTKHDATGRHRLEVIIDITQ